MESVESNEGGETLALGGAKCFHFFPFSIYFSQWMAATYRTNLHGRKTCSIYVVDEQRQINRYRYRYIYLWYLKIQFKQTPPDIERQTPGGILSVSSINFGQFCNILAINKNYWKMVSLLGSKFIPSVSNIVIKSLIERIINQFRLASHLRERRYLEIRMQCQSGDDDIICAGGVLFLICN